jgi:hypothetical protein
MVCNGNARNDYVCKGNAYNGMACKVNACLDRTGRARHHMARHLSTMII